MIATAEHDLATRAHLAQGFGRPDDTFLVYSDCLHPAEAALVIARSLSGYAETFSGSRSPLPSRDVWSTVIDDRCVPINAARRVGGALLSPQISYEDVTQLPWFKVAHSKIEPLSLEEVGEIFDGINGLLVTSRFRVVDQALRLSDVTRMSVDAITAFARVPFMARDHLGSWAAFVSRARSEIQRRGEDVGSLARL